MLTNVKAKWVSGNLVFYDETGDLMTFDAANHIIKFDANKQAVIAAISAADVTGAAGANPTQAEYATMVTLANANKTTTNAILAALKTAGIIASA